LSPAWGQGDKTPPRSSPSTYIDDYPKDPAPKRYYYTYKAPAESETGVVPTIRLYDGFDGKLILNWEPVRPDPTHVSLSKNPGKLTITTQRGGIYGSVGPSAKNFYLIRNPVAEGGDFVLTTCIESFKPTANWHQAGLLVYDDDDNYLKCNIEWGTSAVRLKFIRETDGTPVNETDLSGIEHERIWIRLIKRGKSYQRAYSTDGKKFLSAGEGEWGSGAPNWIGILAKNGPNISDGIDAVFDFFEIRSLTPAEKTHEHPPVAEPDDSAKKQTSAEGNATQADVTIEVLEGLSGTMILRGKKEEVKKAADVIRQIEKQ